MSHDADPPPGFCPFDQAYADDPFTPLAAARATQPIFRSDELDAWVLTRHADVQRVLQDPKTFSSAGLAATRARSPRAQEILDPFPVLASPLRATDPPRHTQLRQISQGAVSPRRVAQMEERIRAIATELLDAVAPAGAMEFYGTFAYPYPLSVVSSLLGLPASDHKQLHHWADCRVSLAFGDLTEDEQVEAATGVVEFFHYVADHLARRGANPADDLLTDLVTVNREAEDPATPEELVGLVLGLVTAGHETTANWLTLSMYHLLSAPERWQAFLADPTTAAGVVEETLRFDGPVLAIWRHVTQDVSIGDVAIPAGQRVYCAVTSANRDDTAFTDGEQYRADREDARRHLAFGRGIHTCVGASLARLEGRVAFEEIGRRLPGLRLATADATLHCRPSGAHRQPTGLLLAWDN